MVLARRDRGTSRRARPRPGRDLRRGAEVRRPLASPRAGMWRL